MSKKIVVLTLPHGFRNESIICNSLLARGLSQLHVRKPDFSAEQYKDFIERIEPRYRNRIVIHNHFELVKPYGLKGIHLSSVLYESFRDFDKYDFISVSCHAVDEVLRLDERVSECFLSPIFDSISKEGYLHAFEESCLRRKLRETNRSVLALGGINADNVYKTFDWGFSGAALLGGVWGKNHSPAFDEIMQNWKNITTPSILTIAGFDPSSGAGVSADIKTADRIGVYAFGVNTGTTAQSQYEFHNVCWHHISFIKQQIKAIAGSNTLFYIKIGLVESFEVLDEICDYIDTVVPNAKICWDPILKSSSGFVFHKDRSTDRIAPVLESILHKIYLITPNYHEACLLFGNDVSDEHLSSLSAACNVNILLKGGHRNEDNDTVTDVLFSTTNKIERFSVCRKTENKHGTGCMLSTAIVSYMAKGHSLSRAARLGQLHVAQKMNESKGLLFMNAKKEVKPYSLKDIKLMFLTHDTGGLSTARQVEIACRAGVKIIQLRMKEASEREFLEQARIAVEICNRYDSMLIINDNVDICLQAEAHGVHLGKEDMPLTEAREKLGGNKLIGATCNTFDDIKNAVINRADYIGLGPFRHTLTKKKLSPVIGLNGLSAISERMSVHNIHLPVYAIGGITKDDVGEILSRGIHGVALSSSILQSDDINDYIQQIFKNIESCKR